MLGFELPKGVGDLDATLDDYRPKKWRRNQIGSDSPQSLTDHDSAASIYEEPIGRHVEGTIERSGTNGFHAAPFFPRMNSASFDLRGHHNELARSRLDEIAKAIRTLTYGEMLELAQSMWKVNSHGSEITESDLPGLLHRWSASQR
jgi:hypothetical protein